MWQRSPQQQRAHISSSQKLAKAHDFFVNLRGLRRCPTRIKLLLVTNSFVGTATAYDLYDFCREAKRQLSLAVDYVTRDERRSSK